jgi:succinate dehydrogenase / fumarate reductase cytochrome b subunit
MQTPNRPVFLNLLKIRLPLTGWVSIAHRLTGFGLFLLLPIPLYFWQLSLTGPDGFQQVQSWFGTMPVRLLVLLLLWWFFHHFVSGLRFLLVDLDVGVSLSAARRSATWVLLADSVFLLGGLWLL